MSHLPQIINDLALILVVAAVVSLTFKKLKQPVVLGYLVAGMLVGPHQTYFPSVIDLAGISIWAEIGVIFLLFAIGLEFSFRKLMSVGASAGITSAFQVCVMMFLGFAAGRVVGWDWLNSLFLGAVISISSTTILIKTFDELGLKGRRFVSLVVGILIFEDLAAILLIVLLSTLAISREFQGLELVMQISRLVFFLCLWFMVGVFVLPNLTQRIRALLNAEATLIISLGLCFLMVVLATQAGFSPALGAFMMGSLLAETNEGERIVHVISPVKDLFSAIFFVSVGMLIDPRIIVEQWRLVLFFCVVVVLGKIFSVTFGALISGQNLKTSMQSGLSLAQIGEFSYIIAGVGISLKVTNELLYPLAVALSIVTAFITPYLVRSADGMYSFLEKVVPVRVRKVLDTYSLLPNNSPMTSRREYFKNFISKLFLNTVIIIGIFLAMSQGVRPWLVKRAWGGPFSLALVMTGTLLLCAPFFWALVFSKVKGYSFSVIWRNRGHRSSSLFLALFRIVWGVLLLSALITQFIPKVLYVLLCLLAVTIFMLLLYNHLEKFYGVLETRFLSNLQSKGLEERAVQTKMMEANEMSPLAPWDAHMVEFAVPQDASYVGVFLRKLSLRERYGVTIALIRRGNRRITAPGRNEMLMPLDRIFVIGSDDQLLRFKKFLDLQRVPTEAAISNREYSLEQFVATEKSEFVGKSIRASGIREATRGIVVGVERNGRRILNPDSGWVIEPRDLIWIVGDRRLIRNLA